MPFRGLPARLVDGCGSVSEGIGAGVLGGSALIFEGGRPRRRFSVGVSDVKEARDCDREPSMPGVRLAPRLPLTSCADSKLSFLSADLLTLAERDGDSTSEIGLTSLSLGRTGLDLRTALVESDLRFHRVEDLPVGC